MADRLPLHASIIVPVWNGADTLGPCLQAVTHQTADSGLYQVVVVNDGSTDASAAVASQFQVDLIDQPHLGAAAARNRGAQAALNEILLFTDADCEPVADWIHRMLEPFTDPGVAGVRGVYRTRQRSLVALFAQAEYEEKYRRLAASTSIDFVDTYAAGYRRDTFLQHGGFDPEFLFDEDQELSYRLSRQGLKMVLAPKAVVYHIHPETLGWYLTRKVKLGFWKTRVIQRHPAKALSDSYTPWSQKAQIALAGPVLLAVLFSVLGVWPWWPTCALSALGFLSTVPIVIYAFGQGWAVAVLAPFLAALRALALSLGLLAGFAVQLGNRIMRNTKYV